MDDLVHVDGSHDGGGDGHVLDTEAVGVLDVLFPELGGVVKIFLLELLA